MKTILKNLSNKSFKSLGFNTISKYNKNFSTLIVPEISNGKIHPSVLNLAKAASELDSDIHLLLQGNKVEEKVIEQAKNIQGITKINVYENENLEKR